MFGHPLSVTFTVNLYEVALPISQEVYQQNSVVTTLSPIALGKVAMGFNNDVSNTSPEEVSDKLSPLMS